MALEIERHKTAETARQQRVVAARGRQAEEQAKVDAEVPRQHAEVDTFAQAVRERDRRAVSRYFQLVVDQMRDPAGFPRHLDRSRQLRRQDPGADELGMAAGGLVGVLDRVLRRLAGDMRQVAGEGQVRLPHREQRQRPDRLARAQLRFGRLPRVQPDLRRRRSRCPGDGSSNVTDVQTTEEHSPLVAILTMESTLHCPVADSVRQPVAAARHCQ
jgi:hypothetical protein